MIDMVNSMKEELEVTIKLSFTINEIKKIVENKGFTLKRKKYNEDGSLKENLKQNLEVKNLENGKEFLENIGYIEYFRLQQKMYCYKLDNISFSIFDVTNLGVFVEYESDHGENAEEMKKILDKVFEQDFSNYYEKKAILYIEKYHLF